MIAPIHRTPLTCLFLLVNLSLNWLPSPSGNVAHAKAPNIVMILVDDMGYGDAQCYNPPVSYTHLTLPTIYSV